MENRFGIETWALCPAQVLQDHLMLMQKFFNEKTIKGRPSDWIPSCTMDEASTALLKQTSQVNQLYLVEHIDLLWWEYAVGPKVSYRIAWNLILAAVEAGIA